MCAQYYPRNSPFSTISSSNSYKLQYWFISPSHNGSRWVSFPSEDKNNTRKSKMLFRYISNIKDLNVCTLIPPFNVNSKYVGSSTNAIISRSPQSNSCNMGMSGLPDMSTMQIPKGCWQVDRKCPCYNYYITPLLWISSPNRYTHAGFVFMLVTIQVIFIWMSPEKYHRKKRVRGFTTKCMPMDYLN